MANALIVGSYLKKDGLWKNGIEERRVTKMLEAIQSAKTFVM
jgi:predicted TIM-barrel enzyme